MFGWGYKQDITVFQDATSSLYADKFRKGDVIVLPSEGDLIISGDIHGNIENLRRILEAADLAGHPKRHLVVHELVHNIYNEDFQGDYSYECLLEVANTKNQFIDRIHYLMGNHELCEIQGREIMKDGKPIPLVFGPKGIGAFGKSGGELRESCLQFLKSLPIGVLTPAGVWFSHSTPEKLLRRFMLDEFLKPADASASRGSRTERDEILEDLVWGRDYSPTSAAEFAAKVKSQVLVVGHTPCGPEGFMAPNPYHVIIDSKDSNAVILYLRLDKKYNQKGVLANIRKLHS